MSLYTRCILEISGGRLILSTLEEEFNDKVEVEIQIPESCGGKVSFEVGVNQLEAAIVNMRNTITARKNAAKKEAP